MTTARTRRRRDPDRRERILVAAASLGARHGFDAISMADIGAEAGIVGSGVYRHFGSKTAILVAMADRVMDRLMTREAEIIASAGDGRQALSMLVRDHIEVALTDRDALAVYHREVRTLPEGERRRLSRAQRRYIEAWVRLLAPLRPDLSEREARLAVHAAIGAIQSTLFFRSGLPDGRLTDLLAEMAHGCLGIVAVPLSGGQARIRGGEYGRAGAADAFAATLRAVIPARAMKGLAIASSDHRPQPQPGGGRDDGGDAEGPGGSRGISSARVTAAGKSAASSMTGLDRNAEHSLPVR